MNRGTDDTDASFGDRVFAAVQQILPTRALSSAMHWLMRIEAAWFKNAFIRFFMRLFPTISLDEAVVRHIEAALARTGGRIEGPRGAAVLLGVNPHTLRARLRKLGVAWARFRDPDTGR